jgi:hypothetical protein
MKDPIISTDATDAIDPSLNNWHRIQRIRQQTLRRLESFTIVLGTYEGTRKRTRFLRVKSTAITAVISSKMGKRFGATARRRLTNAQYIDITAATSTA